MRGLVLYSTAIVTFLVFIWIQPVESRGSKSSKGSRGKGKSKGECRIDQDSRGYYYVICDKELKSSRSKPTSNRGNNNETKTAINGKTSVQSRVEVTRNVIGKKLRVREEILKSKQKCPCQRGRRGHRGAKGPKGARGKTGRLGPPGPPGPDGRDGRAGITGAKGPSGPLGKVGLPGFHGIKGGKGETGIQGIKGISGVPGERGLPGNCVKRSNVGNVASPKFYCLPGRVGPAGPTGSRGITGVKGTSGLIGPKGAKGDSGVTGTRGRTGRPGSPGDRNNFICSARYTSWINSDVWDSQHPDVHCDSREFLQGFRVEKVVSRKRYRYTCCTLTK